MALTFGRLPTTDSLGSDMRENTLRKSTYPSLAYDAEGDGVGLSIDMSSVVQLPNAAIRLVYNRINPENDKFVYREDALDLGSYNAYVLQFETGIPGDIWRDTILVSNFMYVPNFPSLDMTGSGFKPVNVSREIGDYWKQTFFAESRRFLDTRFDVFGGVSFLKTNAHNNYSEWSLDGLIRYRQSLLCNDGKSTRWGRGFYTGARYTMPFEWLKEPIVGIEYNYGSRYWLGMNPGSEDPLHKLDRLGSVWDFYYIQPIDKNLFLRLGCTFVHTNYSNYTNVAGTPARHNETINNPYMLLDAKF